MADAAWASLRSASSRRISRKLCTVCKGKGTCFISRKSKGKRQKAKGKRVELCLLFLIFDFCLLPFDFASCLVLHSNHAQELFDCLLWLDHVRAILSQVSNHLI